VPKLKVYEAATFCIQVQGALDQSWSNYYAGMAIHTEIDSEEHAVVTLTGQVQDQAALLGMLNRLVDMGLPLLLVQYIPEKISENLEE
jgi:hypothetical protein